ncbi:O-antigen ligase family protein [Candidatus Nitrospira bockiana]
MNGSGFLGHVQDMSERPAAAALLAALVGLGVGVVCGLVFSGLKPIWMMLIPLALLVFLPTCLLKDPTPYWLALFLFVLQFDVKKNLADPIPLLAKYGTYPPFVFVPEVYASDFIFLLLLLYWANRVFVDRQRLYIPPGSWLAIGFMGWALLSILKAEGKDLVLLELIRQAKFFLIFLYAANNLTSKRLLRVVCIALIATLLLQGGISLFRYKFQYYEPLFGDLLGRTNTIADEQAQLLIDPSVGDQKQAYGTLNPPSMGKYFLLLLPPAILLSVRNPLFGVRWVFLLATLVGGAGLYLTYSRTNLMAFGAELALCYLIATWRGYISKNAALVWLFIALCSAAAATPVLYKYFDRKIENVEIRFAQYDTALAMFKSNPALGVGLNNNLVAAPHYHNSSFSLIDHTARATEQPIHSFYLSLLVEIGVLGWLLYLAFFARICRTAWGLGRSRCQETRFAAGYTFVALVGLGVGVLTNPLWEESVQSVQWMYAGLIMGLSRTLSAEDKRTEEAPAA